MTTTVSKNKVPMSIIFAGIGLMVVMLAVSASTFMNNSNNVVPPSESNNVPETSSNDMPSASTKDPTVFDKSYAQYLLDQSMASATKDAKAWEMTSEFILLYIKGNKNDLTWSPEKVTLIEGKNSNYGSLYFGLDDSTGKSFYAGPVVRWCQEKPGDPITYEVPFIATTGGDFTEWREIPYKYGIETYTNPPPEILKIFSDNNAKLIY